LTSEQSDNRASGLCPIVSTQHKATVVLPLETYGGYQITTDVLAEKFNTMSDIVNDCPVYTVVDRAVLYS